VIKVLGPFFGFCATNMPASLAAGHELTSHAELKAGVVNGFPDPKQPSFIPDRGGEVKPQLLTGAVATLLIIDVVRVKSTTKLITDHP
jgi:hypothetical protein